MCDTDDDGLPPREADRYVLRGMSPNGLNCDMKVYVAMPAGGEPGAFLYIA